MVFFAFRLDNDRRSDSADQTLWDVPKNDTCAVDGDNVAVKRELREKRVDPGRLSASILTDRGGSSLVLEAEIARSDSCTSVGSKARCSGTCLHSSATRVLTSNTPIPSAYIEHPLAYSLSKRPETIQTQAISAAQDRTEDLDRFETQTALCVGLQPPDVPSVSHRVDRAVSLLFFSDAATMAASATGYLPLSSKSGLSRLERVIFGFRARCECRVIVTLMC